MITGKIHLLFNGTDMNVEQGLRSFTYFESVYGCAAWALSTQTDKWKPWDQVIQDGAKNPCKLRWGYLAGNVEHWGEWRKLLMNGGRFHYKSGSLRASVQATDIGIRLRENCSERVFKDMTISDMVSKIAEGVGLTADVEPTEGKYTLYTCTLDDGAFLRYELLPRAVSSKDGRTDYYLYVKNGDTLVFKPPDFGASDYTFRLAPTPGREGTTAIAALGVDYRRVYLPLDGSLSTMARGFDPLKKVPVFWKADDDSVSYRVLADAKPPAPKKPSTIMPLVEPHPDQFESKNVENRAKSTWSRELHGLFRIALRILPLPEAKVASTVDLEIEDSSGNEHFLGGNYFVYAIRHVIRPKVYNTVLYLERRTTKNG